MVKVSGRIMSHGARDIFAYIGNHLFEHAFTCDDKDCLCRASIFNDALADLKEVDKQFISEVEEIWNRDND